MSILYPTVSKTGYRGVLIKFTLSTGGASLSNAFVRGGRIPKFMILKFVLKKLQTRFSRTMQSAHHIST